jgi:hypothetical protein
MPTILAFRTRPWLALAALCALASACSYARSEPLAAGRRVVLSGQLPADLQAVTGVCTGDLTFTAGQTDFQGRRDLLRNCLDASGGIDTDPLYRASPDDAAFIRWSALTGVIASRVNQTFASPLPTSLGTRQVVRQDVASLGWVLPLYDAALANSNVPPLLRANMRAAVAALIAQGTCRLTASAAVTFRRVALENLRVRWNATDAGAPSLRIDADFAANDTVATYAIVPAFACGGSTNNPVHALLNTLLPGDAKAVSISDGGLTVDALLEATDGRVVGRTEVAVDVRAIRVARPFDWVPDDAWRAMLADHGVTARSVADDVQPRIAGGLANLGVEVGNAVHTAVALQPGERVHGVGVDDAAPRNLVVRTLPEGCVMLASGQVACRVVTPPRCIPRVTCP